MNQDQSTIRRVILASSLGTGLKRGRFAAAAASDLSRARAAGVRA